jgi:hypothetical protein
LFIRNLLIRDDHRLRFHLRNRTHRRRQRCRRGGEISVNLPQLYPAEALDPELCTPDFDEDGKTENIRIACPIQFIANASSTGRAKPPKNLIMLTCDAFGGLPPVA